MRTIAVHQQSEAPHPAVSGRAAGRESSSAGCGRPGHPEPRRWGLVDAWNGALIATFEDEATARKAMTKAQHEDIVVLALAADPQLPNPRADSSHLVGQSQINIPVPEEAHHTRATYDKAASSPGTHSVEPAEPTKHSR